jgi:bacteriorhodopsin
MDAELKEHIRNELTKVKQDARQSAMFYGALCVASVVAAVVFSQRYSRQQIEESKKWTEAFEKASVQDTASERGR